MFKFPFYAGNLGTSESFLLIYGKYVTSKIHVLPNSEINIKSNVIFNITQLPIASLEFLNKLIIVIIHSTAMLQSNSHKADVDN